MAQVAATNGNGQAPAADPAAAPGKDYTSGVDVFQKGPLVKRVWDLLKGNYEMKCKWCSFCQVHEATGFKPATMDEAFLMTFLDSLTGDAIPEFTGTLPKELQEPSDWIAKAAGKGCAGGAVPGAKGGGGDDGKIFVGGLPKTATEQAVTAMLSQFGSLSNVQMKWAEDGMCRGFAFATFADASGVQAALAASQAGGTTLDGKRVELKTVEKGGGKGGGDKGGWDKGGWAKGGAKGGWDQGKGKGGFDKGKGKGSWDQGKGGKAALGWDGGKGGKGKGSWDGGKGGGKQKGADKGGSSWQDGGDAKRQRTDSWGAGGGGGWGGGQKGGSKGSGWGGGCAKGGKGGKGGKGDKGPPVHEDDPRKIFVGALPRTTTEQSLSAHFSQFGAVSNVQLKYDPEGGFRGFGFVTFQDRSAADAVCANHNGNNFEGKWIDCKLAGGGGKGGKGGK